jgi:hypothetical protein
VVSAAQSLSFEQRKELIKALLEQFPKPESLAGSITHIGGLETATLVRYFPIASGTWPLISVGLTHLRSWAES